MILLAGAMLAAAAHADRPGAPTTAGGFGVRGGALSRAEAPQTSAATNTLRRLVAMHLSSASAALGSIEGLVDWYPSGPGLRVSLGAIANPALTSTAEPLCSEYVFDGSGTAPARASLNRLRETRDALAPYAGLGFQRLSSDRRVALVADVGVAFTGSRSIGPSAACAARDAALCSLIERGNASADASRYRPLVSLGVTYRF